MRVLYDGVIFQNTRQRGIQRLFRELIGHLPEDVEALITLLERAKGGPLPRATVVKPGLAPVGFLPRKLRRKIQPVLAAPRLARLARSCSVFHSTYYTLPPAESLPAIVHVYDMIPEALVDFFQGQWLEEEIERKRRCIEKATHIITISRATARQLERFYPKTKGRITPIHLGREHLEHKVSQAAAPAQAAYALFVGDRALYKNFGLILDAMETPRWPKTLGLVVVGPPWRANEALRVDLLSKDRSIRHAGRVGDDELTSLYRNAACVLVPSLAEGFGFPVLEGQTAGVPVVCSDIEVFREIAADGALFFNPHNPEELASRVSESLDPEVRARLLPLAAPNLSRFSWSQCAAETVAAYRAVARK